MKRYFYVSGILGGIALICAVLIALVNMLTKPIISNNSQAIIKETYTKIYSEYYSSEEKEYTNDSKGYIKNKLEAYDSNGNVLGYIYTTSGKNAYGEVSLMIGIKNDTVVDVEFLTNTESFASTVYSYVKENLPSSNESKIEINPYGKDDAIDVGSLSSSDIDSLDTKCGATYGASLVKAMVEACLEEAKEGN